MKFLLSIFVLQIQNQLIFGSFIETYIEPSIAKMCGEVQQKMIVKYAFRLRVPSDPSKINPSEDVLYLFTENYIYSVPALTVALQTVTDKMVLKELLFNRVYVKPLSDFWNQLKPNDEKYNTIFSAFDSTYLLLGNHYRKVNISIKEFKVLEVGNLIDCESGEFAFMKNPNIKDKGLENICGVDFSWTFKYRTDFQPIRVYVRDMKRNGFAISFAFPNTSQTEEQFKGGKKYDYRIDSAAYLTPGRSLNSSTLPYNHYFELRTRKGTFSLFDFTNNNDNLLIGANEELLGCPPSFCQTHRFDDIIRLHNGEKLLVYREWMWHFIKPGDRIVYEDAIIANISSRKHLKENSFKKPFDFAIRHIVDGSFISDGKLFIFRNGSFIKSEDDTIINKLTPFEDYEEIESYFEGVPSQSYDALFFHKESKTIYFFLEDQYWAYSMANSSRGLISNDFPKHIEKLGLPRNLKIKATYVEEDADGNQIEFYFFTNTRFMSFKSAEFKNGKFETSNIVYKCTSTNFLGCPHNDYFTCPPDPEEEIKSSVLIFVVIGIIVVVVALMALILLFITLSKPGKQNDDKKCEPSNEEKKRVPNLKAQKSSLSSSLDIERSNEGEPSKRSNSNKTKN